MRRLVAAFGEAARSLALRLRMGRPGAQVLVVAHRGASGSAPENTLAALRAAVALGATWAEVDVQRTRDGVLVLVHDDSWARTAGLEAPVRDLPWGTVRGLDAGAWFGPAFRGERPPSLDAALELAAGRLHLDLEIKSPEMHPGLGREVVDAVRRRGMQRQVLVTSFDLDLVDELASAAPDLEFGYLAASPVTRSHPAVRTHSLHYEVVLRAPAETATARARGVRVLVWTVDDPALARRLVRLGVDGIITNHPERFAGPGKRNGPRFLGTAGRR